MYLDSPLPKNTLIIVQMFHLILDQFILLIKIFSSQMEAATRENKSVIILGDANICAIKLDDPNIKMTETAEELKSSLAQCGLTSISLRNT